MNQELAMELLTQAGMHVTIANHGQEALDILDKDPNFDGVLMDCQMPIMDGYTATRAIRKLPQFAKLPIIAMTANAMAGDREKVIEAGMWDHIAKPLNVQAMFGTIAKWIKPANPTKLVEINTGEVLSSSGKFPLFNLKGIDVRAGLNTTMNNEGLYRRLLTKFY
jgi:CheY-like chemotaxis protein